MASDAIVIASGRSVWDDLRVIEDLAVAPTYFAVNDMIMYARRCDHAVSHHSLKLPFWVALRPWNDHVVAHSTRPHQGVHRVWKEFRDGRGTSALLAAQIALALGHARVFLAGVPLDSRGYVWSDPQAPRQKVYDTYRAAWQERRASLDGHVFSPSGVLRELLGWPPVPALETVSA